MRQPPAWTWENESAVQEALSRLLQDKTVLVIAHRMRTVAGADHIVVLENGHVSQQGTPEELMKPIRISIGAWQNSKENQHSGSCKCISSSRY